MCSGKSTTLPQQHQISAGQADWEGISNLKDPSPSVGNKSLPGDLSRVLHFLMGKALPSGSQKKEAGGGEKFWFLNVLRIKFSSDTIRKNSWYLNIKVIGIPLSQLLLQAAIIQWSHFHKRLRLRNGEGLHHISLTQVFNSQLPSLECETDQRIKPRC